MRTSKLRYFLLAMSFAWIQALAFDPTIDLKDAKAIAQGQCEHESRVYVCFLLEKAEQRYIVALGNEGPVAVYFLKTKELKDEYTQEEMLLVWKATPKRRKSDI